VCAVAGIARPERFFEDLRAAGWTVAEAIPFRDHHSYTVADAERIATSARTAGADAVLTTEKDAVRLENVVPADLPIAVVPLAVTITSPAFGGWLRDRLRIARLGSTAAARPEVFGS
jgi:tetraacyldisaccharide 4'-kinase